MIIHETVATALLDAVALGPVVPTGGVLRSAVETDDAVSSVANNLAVERYRAEHPDAVLDPNEPWVPAIREGRELLAADGVVWLLAHGHVRVVEGGGLALGKPYRVRTGTGTTVAYVPGSQREEELFHRMRRTTPKRLDLLRESIATLGDLREFFPVLEDDKGNVVDGRHRRALDPEWPAAKARVPREARVAVAVAANRSNAWTAENWKDLQEHHEFVQGKKIAPGELARLALLEDHERYDSVISKLIGCDDKTVASAREDLQRKSEIPIFDRPRGRPRKDGTPAQRRVPKTADPALQEELLRRIAAGEPLEIRGLADRFDISPSTLHTAAVQARTAAVSRQSEQKPEQVEHECICPACGNVHKAVLRS